MKRGQPLRRGKPLKTVSPLKRTTGLARGSSIERTARKRKAARDTGPSQAVRKLVLDRDGHACVCCGRSVVGQPYSLQHRKRRSQGGDNSPSNLITVLGTGTTGCHERIDSRRDPSDEAKGYTVRSYRDPALIPVMVFTSPGSGFTAWPTDDGKWSFASPGEEAAA